MNSRLSTAAVAVSLSLAFVVLMVVLGGAIAGNYILMVHYVHSFNVHEQAIQAKAGVPVCKALKELASIHGGHVKSHGYGAQLQVAFQRVYNSTGCQSILSGNFRPHQ